MFVLGPESQMKETISAIHLVKMNTQREKYDMVTLLLTGPETHGLFQPLYGGFGVECIAGRVFRG